MIKITMIMTLIIIKNTINFISKREDLSFLGPSTALIFNRFSTTRPINERPVLSNSSKRRIGSERRAILVGGMDVYGPINNN